MPSAVAAPGSQPHLPALHQYGTRIRSNSVLRPSVRLRQPPEPLVAPRRIKPVPTSRSKPGAAIAEPPRPDYPTFPPAHAILHPEDASSKVMLAIGRTFLAVNNRAMTIKDLAELTLKYGLMCQNVSAASQAITTYIRAHLARCEEQDDHPLLLRHILSGTASDDDLVPALHSRVGGAHCPPASESRITNFRRGTCVWYLSKAAGAPCPFARAGIRLCDYGENGKVGCEPRQGREKKRERDRLRRAEQCGRKRKRLLRSCADKRSDSDSSSEEEKRPPKVKLTLRLRPPTVMVANVQTSASSALFHSSQTLSHQEVIDLSRDEDSDSDADSDASSSSDSDSGSESDSDSMSVTSSESEEESQTSADSRRFPSLPFSTTSATPPPESGDEDEEEEHPTMLSSRRRFIGDAFYDSDEDDEMSLDENPFDFDFDAETQWESPGPRSPSAQFEDDVVVKQEPTDVGSLLAAWDDLSRDPSVADVVARAAAGMSTDMDDVRPKLEDPWSFPLHVFGFDANPSDDLDALVKQEEEEFGLSLFAEHRASPESISPISPALIPADEEEMMARRHSDYGLWRDAEVLGPDSVLPEEIEESEWHIGWGRRGAEAPGGPAGEHASTQAGVESDGASAGQPRGCVPPRLDLQSPRPRAVPDVTSPTLLTCLTSLSLQTPLADAHAHTSWRAEASAGAGGEPRSTHALEPCDLPVSVTLLEGVVVYQMTLGPSVLLRRADSDYVNATRVAEHLGVPLAPPPAACVVVVVAVGSPAVRGSWVPLAAARTLFEGERHPALASFLSDGLAARFARELQGLRAACAFAPTRACDGFGPHFRSTVDAGRREPLERDVEMADGERERDDDGEKGPAMHHEDEDEAHALETHRTFELMAALLAPAPAHDAFAFAETPLSPTEEEMFRVLCSDAHWEVSAPPPPPPPPPQQQQQQQQHVAEERGDRAPPRAREKQREKQTACADRPLRRSKRVADAIANRTRTRSSKRGSRSSLS